MRFHRYALALPLLLVTAALPAAELNQNCTVSILNRTAQVDANGFWRIDNVPTNTGPARARAVCTENGVTTIGASDWFNIPTNGVIFADDIVFDAPPPVPAKMTLTAPQTTLAEIGDSVQLSVLLTFPDGSVRSAGTLADGTSYTTTNARIVTVSPNGRVTATGTGTALVSAANEGSLGILRIAVSSGPADSDGDGMPDNWELTYGFNPSDPADAAQDADGDGLTNLNEFQRQTDPRNADTDGDGVRDGLEITTGSDPLDPASFNLSGALSGITLTPSPLPITINTVIGDGTRLATVTGNLIDGTTIDLTAASRGTTYTSSNAAVAAVSGAAFDGQVTGITNGTATVTARNNGFVQSVQVPVSTFSPVVVGSVDLGGYGNDIAVSGNYAYTATGAAGLRVVNLSSRQVVGSYPTKGNSYDVEVRGNLAYLAEGTGGMQIVDVSVPTSPQPAGWVDTPGVPIDLAVANGFVYVADRTSGLQVIDATNPGAATIVATVPLGDVKFVDVVGNLAAVCTTGNTNDLRRLYLVDVTDPRAPVVRGSIQGVFSDDVRIDFTGRVFVSSSGTLSIVDAIDPAAPFIVRSVNVGATRDIVLAGGFVIGNELPSGSGASIVDVADPTTAGLRTRVPSIGVGTGIAADSRYIYRIGASTFVADGGTTGSSSLYIIEYVSLSDTALRAPSVRFIAPAPGTTVPFGGSLDVTSTAADDVGVAAVDFLVNDRTVTVDSVVPYRYRVAAGAVGSTLTFRSRARDTAGNATLSAPLSVQVVADTQPPSVTIIPPGSLPGATTVFLNATASDNAAVTSVELFADGVSLGVDTVAPYVYSYFVANGPTSVTFTARALDPSSNVGTSTLTVAAKPDLAPTATILAPNADMIMYTGAELRVRVRATDDESVSNVELWANGVMVAEDDAPAWYLNPKGDYELFYDVPDALTSVTIQAAAVDALGQRTFSAPMSFNFKPTAALGTVALQGLGWDVEVRGNYAYVASRSAGLQVIDVSNTSAPAVVATLDTPGDATHITILGKYAYIGEADGMIHVVDISIPNAPAIVGGIRSAAPVNDIALYRDRMYVANDVGLDIIDLRNPLVPRLVKRIATFSEPRRNRTFAVSVFGDQLFMVKKNAMTGCSFCAIMTISSLTDPDTPSLLGTFGPAAATWLNEFEPGDYVTLSKQGNHVFAVGEDWSIAVDVSNPALPKFDGYFDVRFWHYGWRDMDVHGPIGVVAWMERDVSRVWLTDLRNTQTIMMSGSINFSALGPYHGTAVDSTPELVFTTGVDHYISNFPGPSTSQFYIGRYETITDIAGAAPTATIKAATTSAREHQGVPVRVEASDDVAVASVTLSMDGVAVETDRTPPYDFMIVTHAGVPSHTLVATATDYAGNSGQSAPVTITLTPDTTPPAITLLSPVSGESVPAPAVRLSAQATDDFSVAFVEFFVNGMLVATDNTLPYEYDYTFPSGMTSVTAYARAYDPSGNNTSTPLASATVFAPVVLASLPLSAVARDVDVDGQHAYAAVGNALQIFSLGQTPALVGSLSLPSDPVRVRVLGNYVYMPRSDGGLSIIDVSNPAAPVAVSAIAAAGINSVGAFGQRLYTNGTSRALRSYSVSNIAAPALTSSISLVFDAQDVNAYGDLAVGAQSFNFQSSITAWNMVTPPFTADGQAEFLQNGTSVRRLATKNGVVAAAVNTGLVTTSLDDRMGWSTTVLPINLVAVAMSDRYIFGASLGSNGRVSIYDATDARQPLLRGSLSFPLTVTESMNGMAATPTLVVATASNTGTPPSNHLLVARYREFTDAAGIAPAVTLAPAGTGRLNRLLTLTASAADDVGVQSVVFSVNGIDVFTDTVAPYQFNALAPSNGVSMNVSVRAIDYGGNVSQAATATVTLTP